MCPPPNIVPSFAAVERPGYSYLIGKVYLTKNTQLVMEKNLVPKVQILVIKAKVELGFPFFHGKKVCKHQFSRKWFTSKMIKTRIETNLKRILKPWIKTFCLYLRIYRLWNWIFSGKIPLLIIDTNHSWVIFKGKEYPFYFLTAWLF